MRPEARAVMEELSLHAVPLLAYPHDNPAIDGWLTGGTGVLVQTPLDRVLITANHVVTEIEALRCQAEIDTFLGGRDAAPTEISGWRVLDRNERLDICVIQVPDTFDCAAINKSFYIADFNLASRAEVDDEALIIGFPREHRTAAGSVIHARMLQIIDFVKSVSLRQFVIADPENEREIVENGSGFEVPVHLGGASGAPVFRVSLNKPNELIGIFTGGADGLHGAYFCTHIEFLSNDGRIDLLKLPIC